MNDTDQITETARTFVGSSEASTDDMLWYGVYSFGMAATFMVLQTYYSKQMWLLFYREGVTAHIVFYLGTGLSWLHYAFFYGDQQDKSTNTFLLMVYNDIAAFSVFGPFFWHFYALAKYLEDLWDLDGSATENEWIGLIMWVSLTLAEMLVQIYMMPGIFREIENLGGHTSVSDGNQS